VSSIILPGSTGSINNLNLTQAQFRGQIAAITEAVRQLGGNPDIGPGTLINDPLSAPYVLYVNPYTGRDTFVGGSFSTGGSATERIELQRLECGYTQARPFKTINRAVIEAGIITCKSYYEKPLGNNDLVSIVLAPGAGCEWASGKEPTDAELQAFNPQATGAILLPRGATVTAAHSDLRKTIVRPAFVPTPADEAADYSNRRAVFKLTGVGYFFGFTFMDKVGSTTSHHLLDCFQFASKTELDEFYLKIRQAFAGPNNTGGLDPALAVTSGSEYEIVGPIDITQAPSPNWDTTVSASPYIFNCSVRSDYGLCGAFMDGSRVSGLKSMVCANFTGVSLQKDMSCWQRFDGTNWVQPTYSQYISEKPDNIRMNPARLSRHIACTNDAFIQEVSVFAIGHGIHHYTDLGGEITVTNSNSSFGGCAAVSRGYKNYAFPQDKNWTVNRVKVPLNISEKTGNVRRIFLGAVSAVTGSTITLASPLDIDESSETVPSALLRLNYSLAGGTKIWVENTSGDDWRTDLTSSAWNSANPAQINIQSALTQAGTNAPIGIDPETSASYAIGSRVYIRRVVDSRTPNERRLALLLSNTTSARTPERNFVLQTDPGRPGGAISRVLQPGGSEVFVATNTGVGSTPGAGVNKTAEVTIRRGAPSVTYTSGTYYRVGTVVKYGNKHYRALKDHVASTATPNLETWSETFVHMPSGYNAEDALTNEAPILILDTDTDPNNTTTTCGINFTTVWTSAGPVRDQYRSGTDYLGVHAFLVALGLSSTAAHNALVPVEAENRDRDPASSADFPVAPSGGAATGRGNWAVEFRRPSVLRLYGHAWEWAGFLNYSKSIPAAQQELSPQNKFSYYFTNEAGGRVVPQGSNEDGFNITPRGLEDIETGTTVAIDSIGTSTLDELQTTSFETLSVTTLTVEDLKINSSVDFPDVVNVDGTFNSTGVATFNSLLAGGVTVRPGNFARIQVEGTSSTGESSLSLFANSSVTGPTQDYPALFFGRSSGTDLGSFSLVRAEDKLGLIRFSGTDGTKAIVAADILCVADGTPGVNNLSARIEFRLSPGANTGFLSEEAMRLNKDRRLLIGYTADNSALVPYLLQVNSPIFATSSTIATSDGRYKENVTPLTGCLDLIKAARPVSFTWKPQKAITRVDENGNKVMVREAHNFPPGIQVGWVAQEMKKVLVDQPWMNSIVKENARAAVVDTEGNELAPEEKFYGIAEGSMIAVLHAALKEAVSGMESEMDAMKKRIAALEKT
jgi:hypothetical protein